MKSLPSQEPASTIVKKLGGEASASKITGTRTVAPYRWQYPRERGGTGGLIPQRHHPAILAYARENGIPLQAADFLPLSEASTRAPDDNADHAPGPSAGPTPETVESPLPVRGSADPVVTPAPTGG